jgi:hypothetical protein
MPAHAFGERKYFGGTFASKICDKEHSSTALSDSVPAAVQHSPRNVTRPDVNQRLEDDSKVSTAVTAEKARDVFCNGDVRLAVLFSEFANNSNCFMEESAPRAREPCALAGYAQIGTRKTIC